MLSVNKVVDFEAALHDYMNSENADLMSSINEIGDYNDDRKLMKPQYREVQS